MVGLAVELWVQSYGWIIWFEFVTLLMAGVDLNELRLFDAGREDQ